MNNSLSGRKLLLLGGVIQACEIVKEAKKIGVTVYVTDNREDSPAKKIADYSFMIDATDIDAVVKLCKEIQIDGVITGYVDMLLPYCQKVCERLGKPFWGNVENIDMCINKDKFKLACESFGVPVVPWRKANRNNYLEILKDVVLPVVMKPVDNSGSRGVFKCFESFKMLECAEKALSFSKCGEILIEEAMNPHNEFSVYYIMNHGNCYLAGMGDRYVNIVEKNIAPVGQGMLFPSIHLDDWIEKMDLNIKKFFHNNKMEDGFVFLQGFYKNSKFYIHEIGYRLNGGFSYKIAEYFLKYNQVQELIKFSLTGDMEIGQIQKSNPYFNGFGMIVTVSLKQGIIGSVSGVEKVRKTNGVINIYQLHEIGDKLLAHGTTAQVFAYILCTSSTADEMKEIVQIIAENIKVTDINGNNLMNPIILPQQITFGGKRK